MTFESDGNSFVLSTELDHRGLQIFQPYAEPMSWCWIHAFISDRKIENVKFTFWDSDHAEKSPLYSMFVNILVFILFFFLLSAWVMR